MKNNTPTGIDKFVQPLSIGARVIPLLVALVSAVLTQPLFAQVVAHDIQITENSSTSLSATFDTAAVTVQNTSTDRWTLTFPAEITFFVFALNGWTEPESALGNIVDSPGGLGSFGTNQLFVFSDFPTGSDIPDGTTLVQSLFVGDVRSSVNITFHDNAAANEGGSSVPDTGSTFGLLVVSLIALLGASRPLAVRLA